MDPADNLGLDQSQDRPDDLRYCGLKAFERRGLML